MDVLVLLIVFSQVALYLLIGYMFHALQRKYRERNSSGLQEALIAREDTTGEHRIDVASQDADEEVLRCRVCAFANAQRFQFCVICGEKLKLSPTERARPKPPLTTRQIRARRRVEWQRRLDSNGQAVWERTCLEEEKGPLKFSGFVARFQPQEQGEASETEVVVLEGGQPKAMIAELQSEARLMVIKAVPANEADAQEFATGLPSSRSFDVKGLLLLARSDFPSKYAHFVACASSLMVPVELEVLKLFLRREYVVEESIEYFCCMEDTDTRSVVRIDFADETGVDAGGVHREWFSLVSELVVNPSLGIFTCTNHETQTYFFCSNSTQMINGDDLGYFFAGGRIVGRALLEGEVMSFHFAPALLKIILGIPITFQDFEELDPVAYKGLLWMLEHDGAETLGLDFTATRRGDNGSVAAVELVPDGKNIPVTDANKCEFAERWLHYFLLESVSTQLYTFLKGLYQVIPRQLFMLFDAEELDYMLCGCDSIDVTDWENNTRCSKNLMGTRVLRWFWELVREMPFEHRRHLLQFATGCSRVPLGGFRHLTSHDGKICPFTLKGVHSPYIRSHACFNRLDLPLASSRSELKDVLSATLSTETYGFTTA